MSVSFGIEDALKKATLGETLAQEFDIKLGIHNHGGRHWLGNAEALRWIFANTGSRMGLCLDTAWALDAGEDVTKLITTFKDRLHLLHLKDFTFDPARKHKDVVVGSGNINLESLKATLEQVGFQGLAIIEYEGDPANPVPALKNCVKAITSKIPFKA